METTKTLKFKINPLQGAPKEFTRGQDLHFIMDVPCYIKLNDISNANIMSHLRLEDNHGPSGYIQELPISFLEIGASVDVSKLECFVPASATMNWPVGMAEFDVVFEISGEIIRSEPVKMRIKFGITDASNM